MKLRETAAKEGGNLSDFQEELVQLAAALNGDHRKDIYPNKLVENISVVEALKYVEAAFEKFSDACEKARESGADESEIVVCETSPSPPHHKSFAQRIFSCLVCDNWWLNLFGARKFLGFYISIIHEKSFRPTTLRVIILFYFLK